MADNNSLIPIFLGVAQHAVKEKLGWTFERFSNFIFAPFFPQSLEGIVLLVAIPHELKNDWALSLAGKRSSKVLVTINASAIQTSPVSEQQMASELTSGPKLPESVNANEESWISAIGTTSVSHLFFPIKCPGIFVNEPDVIDVFFDCAGERVRVGSFNLEFLRTPPLTLEEAKGFVQRGISVAHIRVACRRCGDGVSIYFSLLASDDPGTVPEPRISIKSVGNEWKCSCAETVVPLNYLKLGMHELFRHGFLAGEKPMTFRTYYEKSVLFSILSEYSELIRSSPPEEKVQKFLEKHQIMWSFLGPLRIIWKPHVLSKNVGDFGILSTTKSLILVELEKPQTLLARQSGGQSAEIQKGLDQINRWRMTVDDHRLALLADLGIPPEAVDSVKYVLIGGLSSAVPKEELRAIRQSMPPDTSFYTFDELGKILVSYFDTHPSQ